MGARMRILFAGSRVGFFGDACGESVISIALSFERPGELNALEDVLGVLFIFGALCCGVEGFEKNRAFWPAKRVLLPDATGSGKTDGSRNRQYP